MARTSPPWRSSSVHVGSIAVAGALNQLLILPRLLVCQLPIHPDPKRACQVSAWRDVKETTLHLALENL
jgi:hypothetical protein